MPNPGYAVYDIFLAPASDLAAVLWSGRWMEGPALELRTLPDWTLRKRLPLDPSIPPLQRLRAESPEVAESPGLTFAAFSPDRRSLALAFFTTVQVPRLGSAPNLVVTAYDVAADRWVDWTRSLGHADYAYLFPSGDRLVVVARRMLPERDGALATAYALDRATGAIVAERPIPSPAAGYLPFPGETAPSRWGSIVTIVRYEGALHVVTEHLGRVVLDLDTLAVERVDPPLTRELAGVGAAFLPDHLVVHPRLDQLLAIDLADWQVVSTLQHRRTSPPDWNWIYDWMLVGADAADGVVYLADTGQRCLYHWNPTAATFSAPLACDLYLEDPWIVFYGWPAFAPGTTANPAPLASTLLDPARLATAALAATFALASVGKLLTLRSFHRTLARTLPRSAAPFPSPPAPSSPSRP